MFRHRLSYRSHRWRTQGPRQHTTIASSTSYFQQQIGWTMSYCTITLWRMSRLHCDIWRATSNNNRCYLWVNHRRDVHMRDVHYFEVVSCRRLYWMVRCISFVALPFVGKFNLFGCSKTDRWQCKRQQLAVSINPIRPRTCYQGVVLTGTVGGQLHWNWRHATVRSVPLRTNSIGSTLVGRSLEAARNNEQPSTYVIDDFQIPG